MYNFSESKFDLTGKVALITGAAGLLGFEHAYALIEAGCDVVLTDLNHSNLERTKELLQKKFLNAKIYNFVFDVSDLESILYVNQRLKEQNLFVNILINNAAINPDIKNNSFLETSRFESFPNINWDNEIKVGLTGAFNCCKVFGNQMALKKEGVIVNIASDLSVIAPDQRLYEKKHLQKKDQPVKPVSYSVVKHGLLGLTKYLASYWAQDGVRCNSLSPGGILNSQGEEFLSKINKLIPMGRMAYRDEYRGAIQFLCSNASSYMNGHNLVIDGGRSII